jgi:1-deoxy-D-xylulose-5-phosphate reductoisomerase
LTHPERRAVPVPQLDLASGLTLEFSAPDLERYPLLRLAREAGQRGGTYPCAFNAANEVAVDAFLDGRAGFSDIAPIVEEALERVDGAPARDVNELVVADGEARRLASRKLVRA